MDRKELGAKAELSVAEYLERHGVRVLERNVHVGKLEIDLVALEDRTVVIVEVRTRGATSWTSAFGSIDVAKRRRLRKAGERLWQRRFKHHPDVDRVRFDAASVSFDESGTAVIEYVRAAF